MIGCRVRATMPAMVRTLAVIFATAALSGCVVPSTPTASLHGSCNVWYLQNAHDTSTPMYAHVLGDHSDIFGGGMAVPGATMRSDGSVFMNVQRFGQYYPSGALDVGAARSFVPNHPELVVMNINDIDIWFGHGAKCTRVETALGISGLLFYMMKPRPNGNINMH